MPEKNSNESNEANVDGLAFVPNVNAAVFVPSWLQDSTSSDGAADQANGVKDTTSPASEPPIDDWEEAAEPVLKPEPKPTNEDDTTPGTPEDSSEGTHNEDSGSQDDDTSTEEPKKQFNEAGNRTKKEHVNIVFIGHVDAGKSTIGGQILFLTGQVDKRTLEKYEKEAKEKNRESWYLSWALDTNLEERDKGKTVEVGRASFETDSKHFTILDAPGHKSFVPNMIGGASQADLAVLVISARKGEFETGFERGGQTREHAMLAKTAGVKHLMVLINKMDDPTVNWSEARYNECKEKLMPYLKKVGFNPQKDITFMPASGLTGAGLKEPVGSDVCSWYSGPTFLNFIEEMAPISRKKEAPFVMPIVDRYKDMGTVVLGKVEAGSAKLGTKLIVMPNKTQVVVDQLWSDDDEVQEIAPGENVRIKLKGVEEEDISPGFVLCDPSKTCKTGRIFDAQAEAEHSRTSQVFEGEVIETCRGVNANNVNYQQIVQENEILRERLADFEEHFSTTKNGFVYSSSSEEFEEEEVGSPSSTAGVYVSPEKKASKDSISKVALARRKRTDDWKELCRAKKASLQHMEQHHKALAHIEKLKKKFSFTSPPEMLSQNLSHGSQIVEEELQPQGLLKYNSHDAERLAEMIVCKFTPYVAQFCIQGTAAYLIFMALRFGDTTSDEIGVKKITNSAITHIKKIVQENHFDQDLCLLWMANSTRFLHCIRQYSCDPNSTYTRSNTKKQLKMCLINYDMSSFIKPFEDLVNFIHSKFWETTKEKLSGLIYPAIILYDSGSERCIFPKAAWIALMDQLENLNSLCNVFGVDPSVAEQLYQQLFYFISTEVLNSLLLRKDMCNWATGVIIRYNITNLEQWIRDNVPQGSNKAAPILKTLQPVINASHLFQAKKTIENVDNLVSFVDELTASQILKLLHLYTPLSYEEVSAGFLSAVERKLKGIRPPSEFDAQILADSNYSFPLNITHCPSTVDLETVQIPYGMSIPATLS